MRPNTKCRVKSHAPQHREGHLILGTLFTLFYRFSDRTRLKIEALHTGNYDERGCSKITIRATHFLSRNSSPILRGICDKRKPIRREIWVPHQTWGSVGPSHSDDGKEARKLITSLVSERSLDYMAGHLPEQRAFAEQYGEELEMMAISRYGDD